MEYFPVATFLLNKYLLVWSEIFRSCSTY